MRPAGDAGQSRRDHRAGLCRLRYAGQTLHLVQSADDQEARGERPVPALHLPEMRLSAHHEISGQNNFAHLITNRTSNAAIPTPNGITQYMITLFITRSR